MSRPDFIKCIEHTHADKVGQSWCGRDVRLEFRFENIDHAAYNALNGGRLLICPDCAGAALEAVSRGKYDVLT